MSFSISNVASSLNALSSPCISLMNNALIQLVPLDTTVPANLELDFLAINYAAKLRLVLSNNAAALSIDPALIQSLFIRHVGEKVMLTFVRVGNTGDVTLNLGGGAVTIMQDSLDSAAIVAVTATSVTVGAETCSAELVSNFTTPRSSIPMPILPQQTSGFPSMAGKVVLITGASTGFGLAAAQRLVALGATVVGTSRTPGSYPGIGFDLQTLELNDRATFDPLITYVLTTYSKIDVLIDNAIQATLGSAYTATDDELTDGIVGMYINKFIFTRRVLAAMTTQVGNQNFDMRIILSNSTSNDVQTQHIYYNSMYSAAKAAQYAMYRTGYDELNYIYPNVRVSFIIPWGYATQWAANAIYVPSSLDPAPTAFRNQLSAAAIAGQATLNPNISDYGYAVAQILSTPQTDIVNQYMLFDPDVVVSNFIPGAPTNGVFLETMYNYMANGTIADARNYWLQELPAFFVPGFTPPTQTYL